MWSSAAATEAAMSQLARLQVPMAPGIEDEKQFLDIHAKLGYPRLRQHWIRGLLRVGMVSLRLPRGAEPSPVAMWPAEVRGTPELVPLRLDDRFEVEAQALATYHTLGPSRGKQFLREVLLAGLRLERARLTPPANADVMEETAAPAAEPAPPARAQPRRPRQAPVAAPAPLITPLATAPDVAAPGEAGGPAAAAESAVTPVVNPTTPPAAVATPTKPMSPGDLSGLRGLMGGS